MKKITKTLIVAILTAGILGSFASCSKKESVVVKLGITGAAEEDIWQPAIASLKKEGIDIQLVQFSDYVAPSRALEDGDIELHACLSRVFFDSEVKSHNYHIQLIGNTLFSPLKLYSNKIKSISELKPGDVIAIPNEATNEGRALKLLDNAGVIKLKSGAGDNPTMDDIESIPTGVKFTLLAANLVPSTLVDVTAAIINGNYALDFGIDPKTAVASETKPATFYWNLIAARSAELSNKKKVQLYDKIVKAFQTQETIDVFNNQYGGFFSPVGWEIDELAAYK